MEDATSEELVGTHSGDGAEQDLGVRNDALLSEDRGFLPHHEERDVWVGGCLLRVAHEDV